jgi:chemotaxis protein methyltransferase CheR
MSEINNRLSDKNFQIILKNFYHLTGIQLKNDKKSMVESRLSAKLAIWGYDSYDGFIGKLMDLSDQQSKLHLIESLTTNETYFFRESKMLNYMMAIIEEKNLQNCCVWSAASSSGEEAYSIAMLFADYYGIDNAWHVYGNDISTKMTKIATAGLYELKRVDAIPEGFLQKYCLKGNAEYEGMFLISKSIRDKVTFEVGNLLETFDYAVKMFDFIFLRNVLIYFSKDKIDAIIRNILLYLKDDGVLITGHSETIRHELIEPIRPCVYKKVLKYD